MEPTFLVVGTVAAAIMEILDATHVSRKRKIERRVENVAKLAVFGVPESDKNWQERRESRDRLAQLVTVSFRNAAAKRITGYQVARVVASLVVIVMLAMLVAREFIGGLEQVNLYFLLAMIWACIASLIYTGGRIFANSEGVADACVDMLTQIITNPNKLYVDGLYTGNVDCLCHVDPGFEEIRIEVTKTGLVWTMGTKRI